MNGGAGRDIVVVAASAGGVEALRALLPLLPADLPAAVLVVLHVPAAGGTALPRILDRAGQLPAAAAVDGEPVQPGHIYVARPDRHLLVIDSVIQLSAGPRHRGHRPAADPLFFSAALTAGPRTIAVVLSGTLDDGAAGSAAVERRGGMVLIQDPAESAYSGMPRAALAATHHASVLRLREMAARIDEQSRIPVSGLHAEPGARAKPGLREPDANARPGRSEPDTHAKPRRPVHGPPEHGPPEHGPPVHGPDAGPDQDLARLLGRYLDPGHVPDRLPPGATDSVTTDSVSCPQCDQPLRPDEDTPLQFECPAGHTWSADILTQAQSAAVGRALWMAIFRLDERARTGDLLADAADRQGHPATGRNFRSAAITARAAAVMIRRLLNWSTRTGITGPDNRNGA
jgi:two-component system, chemotaxis family, protein-glutamate methylesterase/glutaminase